MNRNRPIKLERLTILFLILSVALTFLIQLVLSCSTACHAQSNKQPVWGYVSLCKDDDLQCIKREAIFYVDNNRGPATDNEIIQTYQIPDDMLFTGPKLPQTNRILPIEFQGCDNQMCDAFIWNEQTMGRKYSWSIRNI